MRIGGLAHATADAIPHTTDIGFFSSEREFVFLDEVLLVDSVINEIPWKVFIQPLRPIDEKIRVNLAVQEGFFRLSA